MKMTLPKLKEIIREQILSLKESKMIFETKLSKEWLALPKGQKIKIGGSFEIDRRGPGAVHAIYKNGKVVGDFHLDRDATEDWWVFAGGKDGYVKEIDDIYPLLKKWGV
jgi:hypothetical protein